MQLAVTQRLVLVLLGAGWLLLAGVWLFSYTARERNVYGLYNSNYHDDDGAEEGAVMFPLRLVGMHNINRACRALLTLTYKSIQSIHRVKEGKTINVVTSSDQKYLPGLIALINSTILHTRNPLAFHIVADIKPESHQHLQSVLQSLFPKGRFPKQTVSFNVVKFDTSRVTRLIKTYANDAMVDPKVHANPSNFARFYFHELFPKLSTAVYMDPDTIMLGNVAELGTILDHQDKFLYAVAQGLPHTYEQAFEWNVPIVQQSFNKKEPYFNAGVAVINFDKWRSENITGVVEHWMALHREQKLWVWGTQPPLMATFYRNYHMLDSSWNVRHFGLAGMVPPVVEFVRAKVLHWNGSNKPWGAECRREPTCFCSCWLPFYAQERINRVLALTPGLTAYFPSLTPRGART